jgi:hypothetical protein
MCNLYSITTNQAAIVALFRYGFGPDDYDKTVSEDYWWDRFEMQDGPWAKAYSLLRAVEVGPRLQSARGPYWNFTRATAIPATTCSGSSQETNSLYRSCRPGSSTSACRLRLWRVRKVLMGQTDAVPSLHFRRAFHARDRSSADTAEVRRAVDSV